MRLKGISWIEQNFDKIFAGVFAVAAVGVLIWQFAGPRSTVTVGKSSVPLDQAFSEVVSEARVTRGKIERDPKELPTLPEGANPVSRFERAYRGPVAPAPELSVALGDPTPLPTGSGGPGDARLSALAELKIDPPSSLLAMTYVTSVDPAEVAADPSVAQVLPAQLPFDKASVTVEATFDGRALRRQLESDPDGSGPMRSMNRLWWEGMQLLGVELKRQELQPDGSWSAAASVPAMPGRFSLVPQLARGVGNMDELARLKEQARDRWNEVRRPTYYREIAGEAWQPPAEQRAADEKARATGADAIPRMRRELADVQRRLSNINDTLAKLPPYTQPNDGGAGRPDERNAPPPPPAGGGRRGPAGPGGGGGGGAGGRPPAAAQPSRENDQRRRGLEATRDELQRREDALRTGLGMEPIHGTRDEAATPAPSETEAAKFEPILDTDEVRLWVHDVSVERGKTYRYSMTLVFDNPMFGKGSVMLPEQVEWSRNTLVRSLPSEWTDPVQTDQEVYYFVTSATEAGAGPISRNADARAELFTFYFGYWRQGTALYEPGDRLIADVAVPDLSKMDLAVRQGNPGGPPPMMPGERGRGPAAVAPPPAAPPPGAPAAPAAGPMPLTQRSIEADATILGVVGAALLREDNGRPVAATEVYLRRGDGSIEVRIPEDDKASDRFDRVSRSAAAAKLAAMPKAPEPIPARPGDRRPGDAESPPAPGGGGGGGGSGG